MCTESHSKEIDIQRLIARARHYCAVQERCASAVGDKLQAWGASVEEAQAAVRQLTDEGYIDEVRFARAYCESKLLHQHWSRQHVVAQLRSRRVDEEAVREGLSSISDDEYQQLLLLEARKKLRLLGGELTDDTRRRLMAFLASRGYTMTEINQALNQLNTERQ